MDLTKREDQEGWSALERLLRVAGRDTGQSRRVANFLLAWHNAEENGGWDPVDLWNVDAAIADDMFKVLRLIRESHRYPDGLGFGDEIAAVWRLWRGGKTATGPEATR
jgi:ParB family chromosome partitioning protein